MALSTAHPTLDISVNEEPDALRLVIRGDLDRESAWALTAAVIRTERVRTRRLVLDLAGLRFIDAGGLRAIADVARRARRQGRTFAIANPTEHVARLFSLTGLDKTMEIVGPTRPD